ncbi:flagellar protein FliS [Cellulosilyticum sp. I15G10I2]|uniref:flagellar protein FliS n=1 Tax=Cellulosilyticum sp. I15G10I2 TaxID=1892843 RepID=UPI00085BEF4B|nr:flagellar protein FliS [Cellulosilyticum sp. I15G10I2]
MTTVSAIANASKGELLCITYEIFLYNIKEALNETEDKRAEYVNKAIDVIKTLAEDLDFEIPITQELFRLYVYVQGVLVQHKVTDENLEHVYEIIDKLYQGFLEIAHSGTEQAAPSMKNTEAIYAGLTYGKSDLNELVIGDKNRGFKA